MPILETYELLEKQVYEIGTRYPTIQAMIDISKRTGESLDTLGVANDPEYESFLRENRHAVGDWIMQMRAIWTDPEIEWSPVKFPIILKMFVGALKDCQAACSR